MLDTILTPRVLATLGIIGLALFAFSFAWAFFKVSFQKALGRPVPRFWLTNALDVAAEVGANLPGAINRALKLAGKPGLFLPTAPTDGSPATAAAALASENAQLRDALAAYQRRAAASRAVTLEIGGNVDPARAAEAVRETLPPVDRDSQRGSVDLGGLVGCLVVALLAAVIATGCPSSLPPVAGCEPFAQACIAGSPHVCSASQRWERAGSLACADVRGVCVVTDGRAHCAAPADAGAP